MADGVVTFVVRTTRASTWLLAVPVVPRCDEDATVAFEDVPAGSVHAAAIGCLAERGIVEGVGGSAYRPGSVLTRGQVASVLSRLLTALGRVGPAAPEDGFGDTAGTVHGDAVAHLAALGLAHGDGDGRFRPDAPVTRAQLVSLLARVHALVGGAALPAAGPPFEDVAADGPHAAAIGALAEAGIVRGVTATTFDPGAAVPRAQAASLVARLLGSLSEGLG